MELLAGPTAGRAGEIVDITGDGFVVAAEGGAVLLKKVQLERNPKIGAAEFARQVGLKMGDRLGE